MVKTCNISISGQVQGVGFRPFVVNMAMNFSLQGNVSNNENGVLIYVTGNDENIQNFYSNLLLSPPPLARILKSSIEDVAAVNFKGFSIVPSKKEGRVNLPMTPDFAICDQCKNEIQNPDNQRYNYPFTSCVNCGPRWAVTKAFPFERTHTSITEFTMCKTCNDEYINPANRRFHSQTNTCGTCGISMELITNTQRIVEVAKHDIFKKIASLLSEGKIIALKNTSGYLLCCNAENKEVVQKLRTKKNRPNKPFAVLYPSMEMLRKEVILNKAQIGSLTSAERPIVIIPIQHYKGSIALTVVAPKLNQLGIMLPYSGILQLLADQLTFPIVATSGNIHGSPVISTNEEAFEKLKAVADFFLHHPLKITQPQDDSVVKFSSKFKKEVLFRRARGYAPNYFDAGIGSEEKIMAMGAHLKSSIAFYPNEFLYLSQYLGNLDNFDVYKRFVEMSTSFQRIFEQRPEVVLVDKHPGYESTRYGKELAGEMKLQLAEIQHHKAHFAAVLGEHNLFDFRVLGVVFDGTGYGDDDQIWGGEFFRYESQQLERIDHIEYFDWLLGDKMSREPRLSLLSLASDEMIACLSEKFTPKELRSFQSVKKRNALKTSSVGRLFDAVASLLNIADINTYEGEAAIVLENALTDYNLNSCKSYLDNSAKEISAKEIIRNIHNDIKKGYSNEQIIANFLFTLATGVLDIAKKGCYKHIAFSGGVFQNTILVDMLLELAPEALNLYFHKDISPNDENISFGQLMYYVNIR